MMQKRKCAKCGKMFQPTNSQSKYCSAKCKVAAKNNNKKTEPKKEAKKTVAKNTEPKKVKVVSHEKIKLPAVKKNKPVAKKPEAPKTLKVNKKTGLPEGCDCEVIVRGKNTHKRVFLLCQCIIKEILGSSMIIANLPSAK